MFEIILSVAFLILDRIYRIYRIEEELSHARLTLHAASALKTRRRQGRGETEHFGLNGSINQQYMALVLWKFANSADGGGLRQSEQDIVVVLRRCRKTDVGRRIVNRKPSRSVER